MARRGLGSNKIFCIVCLETLDNSEFPDPGITSSCTHAPSVCKSCTEASIIAAVIGRNWTNPTCPLCLATLSYAGIARLVKPEILTEYNERVFLDSISKMPDFRWCLGRGCGSGQLHDGGQGSPIITCQKCGGKMCFIHSVRWHKDQTCTEYESAKDSNKNEKASLKYLKEATKACPNKNCGIRIQRVGGCNHMTCTKCKHEFYWLSAGP